MADAVVVPDLSPLPPSESSVPSRRTRLDHNEMLAEVRAGRSVIHDGLVITKEADLPHPADLARGDEVKLDELRRSIDARKMAIEADERRLAEAAKITPKAEGSPKSSGTHNPPK